MTLDQVMEALQELRAKHGGGVRVEWFFILKLPSWDWQKGDYGRRWQWHQLCLVWTDTHGWMTWYEPAKD